MDGRIKAVPAAPVAVGALAQVELDAPEELVTPADYFAGKRCPKCGRRTLSITSVEAQGSVELGVFVRCKACGLREEC